MSAGRVEAHWLDAPGVSTDKVLPFLHGGGYQYGSLRSDGDQPETMRRLCRRLVLFLREQRRWQSGLESRQPS